MKRKFFRSILIIFFLFVVLFANNASAVPVTFTKVTGLTGGSPAETGVYRADLTSIGFDILSISITDNSFGLGGLVDSFPVLILMPLSYLRHSLAQQQMLPH